MTPFEQAKPWRYNGLKEWTAVVRNKNGQTQAASVRYSDSDAIELSLNENWQAKVSAVERSNTKRTPPTVVQLKFDSEPDEAGVVSEFEKKYPHLKVERVNSIREKKWPVFEPKIGDTVSLYKPLSGARVGLMTIAFTLLVFILGSLLFRDPKPREATDE